MNIRKRPARLWLRMQIYHYALYDLDGVHREDTGRMALRDDNAVRAYGKAIIRDIMKGAAEYHGWNMKVTNGSCAVCSLPLDPSDQKTLPSGG